MLLYCRVTQWLECTTYNCEVGSSNLLSTTNMSKSERDTFVSFLLSKIGSDYNADD